MPRKAPDKALRLLDAHVAWVSSRLEGPALQAEIEALLDGFLIDGSQITLNEVVTDKAIHHTVKKYAVDMTLGGAMPELVGDIARVIYQHKIHNRTKLQDLMPDRVFEDILDKVLELKTLRNTLVRESVSNPIFSDLIGELLYSGIRDYVRSSERLTKRVPGASSALKFGKAMVSRASPDLGNLLEENLKAYVQKNTRSSLQASEKYLLKTLDSEEFRDVMLDLWDEHKGQQIATIREFAGSLDIEELFVIIYEYWQHIRHSKFVTTLINAGITTFFKKFGKYTLTDLLYEIGLDRELMIADAMLFAPPVIATMQQKNLLEPFIRRNLQPFYESDAARKILAE